MPWLTDLNNTCARINASATAQRVLLPNVSFAGIPQVLILNIIIAGVLLLGFIILKKSAWAFRLFSLRSDQFYNINVAALFYGPPKDYSKYKPEEDTEMRKEERALIKEASGAVRWLWVAIYKLKDRHFLHRCGQQAVDYLRFQRLMMLTLIVDCIFSLCGLMPIHLIWGAVYGNVESDQYGRTTIANIDAKSYWILAHILATITYSLVVFLLIRRVMKIRLKSFFIHRKYRLLSRTLMVSNVPVARLRYGDIYDEHLIRQYFSTSYPEVNLVRVDLTYNTSKLRSIVDQKVYADFCRDFYTERKRQRAMHEAYPNDYESVASAYMYPSKCQPCRGKVLLRFCSRRVDGEEHYADQAKQLEIKMAKEAVQVQQKPAGVIFLTFESHAQAKTVKQDFQIENRLFAWCLKDVTKSAGPRKGSRGLYYALHVNEWDVNFAPLPRHVSWDNFSTGGLLWWIRAVAINVFLCWFVFFLSTPPIIVNFLSTKLPFLVANPFLAQWLPTISILILPILLPVVIEASVGWAGYYTELRTDYVKLRNVYMYLLLTLCILPGIGVGSANAAVKWLEVQALSGGPGSEDVNWQCVLLPSAGSFFVNVMIAMALLWNAFDVVRIIELVVFEVRYRCLTRSDAERAEMNRRRSDFAFTTNYAYMLTMYSTAVIFGFLCPLTSPFGLLYMCVKHVFDKYSLFYYTTPVHELDHAVEARLSTGLHLVAIRYVYVAHFILHFIMTFFTFLRGSPRPLYVISAISTAVIAVFLVYQLFFAEYIDQALVDTHNECLRIKEEANVAGEGGKRLLLYEAPVFRQSRAHTSPATPLTVLQQKTSKIFGTTTAGATPAQPVGANIFDYKDVAKLPQLPTTISSEQPSAEGAARPAALRQASSTLAEDAAHAAATEGVTPASEGDLAAATPAEEQEQAAIEDDTIPVSQARTESAIPTQQQQEQIEAAAVAKVSRWRRRASAAADAAAAAAPPVNAAGLTNGISAAPADIEQNIDAVYNKDSDKVEVEFRGGGKNSTSSSSPMKRANSTPTKRVGGIGSPRHAAANKSTIVRSDDDIRELLTARQRNIDEEDEDVQSVSQDLSNAASVSIATNVDVHATVRDSVRSAREAFFARPTFSVPSPEVAAAQNVRLHVWPPVAEDSRPRGRSAGGPSARVSDRMLLRTLPQENVELMLARSQSASPINSSVDESAAPAGATSPLAGTTAPVVPAALPVMPSVKASVPAPTDVRSSQAKRGDKNSGGVNTREI